MIRKPDRKIILEDGQEFYGFAFGAGLPELRPAACPFGNGTAGETAAAGGEDVCEVAAAGGYTIRHFHPIV